MSNRESVETLSELRNTLGIDLRCVRMCVNHFVMRLHDGLARARMLKRGSQEGFFLLHFVAWLELS